MKIELTETNGIGAKVKALADDRAMRGKLVKNLAGAWHKAGQVVAGSAVKHRFTGKGAFPVSENRLGVRSGRLRRTIRATAPQVDPVRAAISITMGSDVKYFAIHEFGFEGKVQVRGHTRRNVAPLKTVRGKATKASQRAAVARRKSGGKVSAQVRPHSRKVKVPARAPLGTEIRSERGRGEFQNAQKRAIEQTYREVMA